MLLIENTAVAKIKSCCLHSITTQYPYGTDSNSGWYLPSASVNSTVCTKGLVLLSPYCGGSEEFTFYYNNHSYLTSERYRSCYCHMRTPKDREDVSCFFSGKSCVGAYSFEFASAITDCIISKFSFINNSDSSGCIKLYSSKIRTFIKHSIFSFDSKSNSMKWIFTASSGSKIFVEDSFVISIEPIQEDARVAMSNVKRVSSASTHKQFQHRPRVALYGLKSGSFSGQISVALLLPFAIASASLFALSNT